MPSGRIPPTVIQHWGKVKHDLVPTIEKAKGPTLDSAYKKELRKNVEALFATFDKGLRDKLKKASTAKDDGEAKKALQDVVKISTDYLAKLKKAQAQWGTGARSVGEAIEKSLLRIKDSASSALKAMP